MGGTEAEEGTGEEATAKSLCWFEASVTGPGPMILRMYSADTARSRTSTSR